MKKKIAGLISMFMIFSLLINAVDLTRRGIQLADPVTVQAASGTTYVTTANVNFRSGPGTSYSKIGCLLKGTTVTLVARTSATWYKVTSAGKTGYVHSAYLAASSLPVAPVTYVTTASVNVRSGPGTGYAKIGYLLKGTTVTLVAKTSATWYKVTFGGKTGYVHSAYLSLTSLPVAGQSYALIRSVRVYPTAYSASRRVNPTGVYARGNYIVYTTASGMINVSPSASTPGGWINPADNQPVAYTPAASLGSRLSVDRMISTIRTISVNYPNRAFGTSKAAEAATYLKNHLDSLGAYVVEKQYTRAVNPLLGTDAVPVINVVARLKTHDPSKKDVLFIAHYDTVLNTPGANDNASGVAMLLELARYFSDHPMNFNPVFLVDGGEEKGKPGTEDYLARYRDRIVNHTEIMINLDMVGMSQNYQLWNLNETMQGTVYPQLAYAIGRDLGLQIQLKRNSRGIADYKVFELSQIPTVTFMNITDSSGNNVPYYHTSQDTIGTISSVTLRNVSALVMNLVEYIQRKQ